MQMYIHIKNIVSDNDKIANLISKLSFYKLIPYPIDNYYIGQRDQSCQTTEKAVLYIIPAGPVRECASLGGNNPNCTGDVASTFIADIECGTNQHKIYVK